MSCYKLQSSVFPLFIQTSQEIIGLGWERRSLLLLSSEVSASHSALDRSCLVNDPMVNVELQHGENPRAVFVMKSHLQATPNKVICVLVQPLFANNGFSR